MCVIIVYTASGRGINDHPVTQHAAHKTAQQRVSAGRHEAHCKPKTAHDECTVDTARELQDQLSTKQAPGGVCWTIAKVHVGTKQTRQRGEEMLHKHEPTSESVYLYWGLKQRNKR